MNKDIEIITRTEAAIRKRCNPKTIDRMILAGKITTTEVIKGRKGIVVDEDFVNLQIDKCNWTLLETTKEELSRLRDEMVELKKRVVALEEDRDSK